MELGLHGIVLIITCCYRIHDVWCLVEPVAEEDNYVELEHDETGLGDNATSLEPHSVRLFFSKDKSIMGRQIPGLPGISQCCGFSNVKLTKVIGGVETQPNEFPWLAGLVMINALRPFCGGSLINDRYVLSAAHCLQGMSASGLQVLLGEHDVTVTSGIEVRVGVSQVIVHPRYSGVVLFNDFGLVKLATPQVFNMATNQIAPVCLPLREKFKRRDCVAAGWGRTGNGALSDRLQKVTLKTMSNVECSIMYPLLVWPSMLCAIGNLLGGLDTCQGDSGGPLVVDQGLQKMLVGITSWGFGCAGPFQPGVYSRVTTALDWIITNTADAVYC